MADISSITVLSGDNYSIKDATARGLLNGHSVGTDVPSDAVFTDTTYQNLPASSGGTDLSLVTTGEKAIWSVGAGGAVFISLTLQASAWSSADTPAQTVTASGVTAESNIILGIGSSITSTQYNAACQAKLVCTAQSANSVTIACYGETPTVDVPIAIAILG